MKKLEHSWKKREKFQSLYPAEDKTLQILLPLMAAQLSSTTAYPKWRFGIIFLSYV
jgi:hypothetical protein